MVYANTQESGSGMGGRAVSCYQGGRCTFAALVATFPQLLSRRRGDSAVPGGMSNGGSGCSPEWAAFKLSLSPYSSSDHSCNGLDIDACNKCDGAAIIEAMR